MFNRLLKVLAPRVRIELTTYRLTAGCYYHLSYPEMYIGIKKFLWAFTHPKETIQKPLYVFLQNF